MKTLSIIIFIIFYFNIYSQSQPGWNAIDTTDIPNFALHYGGKERVALFGNHYGIHVLKVLYTGNDKHVKYFRLKTTGELDAGFSSSGIQLDDYGDFPSITGDENILYAVYRKADTIKVHRSTNGGSNWSLTTTRIFSNGNVYCNGVDGSYSSERFNYRYRQYDANPLAP